jgi:hypothetical protein
MHKNPPDTYGSRIFFLRIIRLTGIFRNLGIGNFWRIALHNEQAVETPSSSAFSQCAPKQWATLQISNLGRFAKVHRRHMKLPLRERRARPIASLSYARGMTEEKFLALTASAPRGRRPYPRAGCP